jgi:hypothetical protein
LYNIICQYIIVKIKSIIKGALAQEPIGFGARHMQKSPVSRQACRAFCAHRSLKTAGPKLRSIPKTAAFDAGQGNFPQAPFAAVWKI